MTPVGTNTNASPVAGRVRRDGHVEAAPTIAPNVAELAHRSDWRQAIEALGLPEREARALRVAVVRRRAFGGGRGRR